LTAGAKGCRVTFVGSYLERLVADGLVASNEILACNADEVAAIAQAQGLSEMPETYTEFLLRGGRGAGRLMVGSDWKYPEPLEIKNNSEELVLENGGTPDFLVGSVVFLMHQGYLFYYFPAEFIAERDPPVWLYVEAEQDPPKPTGGRFTDFLTSQERVAREVHEREMRLRNSAGEA
jgi:hypothetical protein